MRVIMAELPHYSQHLQWRCLISAEKVASECQSAVLPGRVISVATIFCHADYRRDDSLGCLLARKRFLDALCDEIAPTKSTRSVPTAQTQLNPSRDSRESEGLEYICAWSIFRR